jgi:SAM-dependent methyltransferase
MTRVSDTRAFYEAGYSLADPAEAARMGRWRAIGARSKAGHVRELCARAGLTPRLIVEIGCGDGSLLAELSGTGATLDGFELSENAARQARERGVARRVEAYDGEHVPADDDAYGLAVLSHVLEHVPQPLPLLEEAARVAPHVLVEVPLEDNPSARRPSKRRLAAEAGHLHAFNRAALQALIREAGLEPRHELTDPLPREHHAFHAGPAKGALKWAVRAAVHRTGAAERLFTVHYAVLATRA